MDFISVDVPEFDTSKNPESVARQIITLFKLIERIPTTDSSTSFETNYGFALFTTDEKGLDSLDLSAIREEFSYYNVNRERLIDFFGPIGYGLMATLLPKSK